MSRNAFSCCFYVPRTRGEQKQQSSRSCDLTFLTSHSTKSIFKSPISSGGRISSMTIPRRTIDFVDLLKLAKKNSAEIDTTVVKETSTENTPRPRRAHRRGVSFNPDVYVQETLHINDFSEEEICNAYWAKSDYPMMKKNMAITVRQLELGTYSGDSDQQCLRGLEHRQRKGSQLRKLNKMSGLCSVLDEQERQRIHGEENDEKIAKIYYGANMHCRMAACKLALSDQEEAMGLHDVTERFGATTISSPAESSARRFFKRRALIEV
jgi:hypothetical protein